MVSGGLLLQYESLKGPEDGRLDLVILRPYDLHLRRRPL
jgi:hypothetical protein